ncbi:MAG: hypothetical protein V4568_04490 [Pseudomonadota bacterium]
MNKLKLMTVLLIVSTSVFAAKDILDFKGFPLGRPVEAFKQKFPSFQCKSTKDRQIVCDSYRETYAGFDADIIVVSFVDGKLQGFQVEGSGEDKISKILAAMKEKYGEPRMEEKRSAYWELVNGSCRLNFEPQQKFQLMCGAGANLPKNGRSLKGDV